MTGRRDGGLVSRIGCLDTNTGTDAGTATDAVGTIFAACTLRTVNGIYADLVLDSSDVCSNCFRQVRVERIDPTREGFAGEYESHYERKKQTTTIEYAPHDIITRSKGVFCQCGCESAYERLWDPTDVAKPRLRELLKNIIRTLDAKGVSLKPKETMAYVLHCWSETDDVDKSLSKGIEMGVVASAAASANANQHTEHEVDG